SQFLILQSDTFCIIYIHRCSVLVCNFQQVFIGHLYKIVIITVIYYRRQQQSSYRYLGIIRAVSAPRSHLSAKAAAGRSEVPTWVWGGQFLFWRPYPRSESGCAVRKSRMKPIFLPSES